MRGLLVLLLSAAALLAPTNGWTLQGSGDRDRDEGYFSLGSDKTFAPEEAATFSVYTRNVSALEFRVYRITDPAALFQKLEDPHTFGRRHISYFQETIDERTWLETFHDWKHKWWIRIRDFFRYQFSGEVRAELRARAEGKPRPSVASFAQVPLINARQLVARWHISIATKSWNEDVKLALGDAHAAGVYAVEATDGISRAYTIVILSRTAMVVKSAPGQVVAFVADRKSGVPVAGAQVQVWAAKVAAKNLITDTQGLAEVALAPASRLAGQSRLQDVRVVAISGKDVAVLTPSSYSLSNSPGEDWKGYAYTDRPVYRPGHTVEFRAILRSRKGPKFAVPAGQTVSVQIQDSVNKSVLQKQMVLSGFGSLHGEWMVPEGAALGYYSIKVVYPGVEGDGYQAGAEAGFYIEEYKKPEYSVTVKPDKLRVLQGETIKATIEARYFFGEPVANAKVIYVVHTSPYWSPYVDGDDSDPDAAPVGGDNVEDNTIPDDSVEYGSEQQSEQVGQLDSNGKLTISIPTKPGRSKRDLRYRIEAKVIDAANREISGAGSAIATYGSFELSVRGDNYFAAKGATAKFTVQARDYDGKPVQTAAQVELVQSVRKAPDKVLMTSDVVTDATGQGVVPLTFRDSGIFRVRVRATTPTTFGPREVESTTYIWISSGGRMWEEDSEQVKIIADNKIFAAGDTAHLLVLSGVPDAYLLVTTEGRSVSTKRVVQIPGASGAIDVPILAEYEPGVSVAVAFFSGGKLYQGEKALNVPTREGLLTVDVAPSKDRFQPGEAGTYTITAKDVHGAPVQGEFSVGVVDEAIYSVRPDQSESLANTFYSRDWNRVNTESSLTYQFSGASGDKQIELASASVALFAGKGGGVYRPRALADLKAEQLVQPKVRKAFPDTAFWQADVRTDARGQARVKFTFPDALTQWRATVKGITVDSKVGAAISKVIVRKNLMVRIAAPRFFRQGDEVTLSAIVHNYLERTKNVQVSMDVAGLSIMQGATQTVSVPSRGEAKVDWRVRADTVREAKILAKALTNEESDAMETTAPVTPYGVKLAISLSGSVAEASGNTGVTLTFPSGTEASGHAIDITLSPSVGGAVLSALPFLTSYPYGCTEQTMSSFLPNIIVTKALQDLKISSGVDAKDLAAKVKAGLDRLYDYQHEDGGWGWWKEDDSLVFMTAYVVEGLTEARDSGYGIDQSRLAKAKDWLKLNLEKHPNMRPELRAFVVYALTKSGERGGAMYDKVWERRKDLSATGIAYIGLAMRLANDARAGQAATILEGLASQNESEAWWPSNYDGLMEFDTDDSVDATAYALRLLSSMKPDGQISRKAALWLVNHRDQGYWWLSTKQTAMAIYGLTEYLRTSHELETDFNATVLMNGKQVLAKHFTKGDALTGGTALLHLDSTQLTAGGNTIALQKSGNGRLYWTARAEYYSTDKHDFQHNQLSLNITRDYYRLVPQQSEGTDGSKISYKLEPFAGSAVPGEVIAVHLTVRGSDWKYAMVEDPIPAGAEFVEKDSGYEIQGTPPWWTQGYTRREFHDDRATMFQTSMYGKHREYFYLIKMVNPGKYRVSPAMVQPMYQPEVLATTDALTVNVEVR